MTHLGQCVTNGIVLAPGVDFKIQVAVSQTFKRLHNFGFKTFSERIHGARQDADLIATIEIKARVQASRFQITQQVHCLCQGALNPQRDANRQQCADQQGHTQTDQQTAGRLGHQIRHAGFLYGDSLIAGRNGRHGALPHCFGQRLLARQLVNDILKLPDKIGERLLHLLEQCNTVGIVQAVDQSVTETLDRFQRLPGAVKVFLFPGKKIFFLEFARVGEKKHHAIGHPHPIVTCR